MWVQRFNLAALAVYALLFGIVSPRLAAADGVTGTCVPVPPGLVSWWPGEGTAADTHGANHAIEIGPVSYAPGKVGLAFGFNGVDSYLQIPNEEPFDFGAGPFSILAWAKTPGHRMGNEHIFSKGNVWAGGDDYVLWIAGNAYGDGFLKLEYAWPGVDLAGVTPIHDDQWHHVVVTQSGACDGCAKLYVDGGLEGTQFGGTLLNGTGPAFIGTVISSGYPFPFNGLIDEVQAFNRDLSEVEVQAIFGAGSAGLCRFIAVSIDIKPGSDPNSINPSSRGVLPVAILTGNTFDASTMNASTVRFGATGTEAEASHSSFEDVDGDGDVDMILHFPTQRTGITCGTLAASLTGMTSMGQPIGGVDSIRTTGCK